MCAFLLAVPAALFAQENLNADVEAKVRAEFVDASDMISIAKCESGFREFGPDGAVLRGGAGKGYLGVFQLGESLHASRALSLGHDLATIDGNIAYARYLYSKNGLSAWSDCLPTAPVPQAIVSPGGLATNLRFGMRHSEVLKLQQMLNTQGFIITASGDGSPGHETAYFGALTRDAVRRFQCAKHIACGGDETTTGYGRVGPLTRAAFNP